VRSIAVMETEMKREKKRGFGHKGEEPKTFSTAGTDGFEKEGGVVLLKRQTV